MVNDFLKHPPWRIFVLNAFLPGIIARASLCLLQFNDFELCPRIFAPCLIFGYRCHYCPCLQISKFYENGKRTHRTTNWSFQPSDMDLRLCNEPTSLNIACRQSWMKNVHSRKFRVCSCFVSGYLVSEYTTSFGTTTTWPGWKRLHAKRPDVYQRPDRNQIHIHMLTHPEN